MKPLFELPQLLTLGGDPFTVEGEAAEAKKGASCQGGCVGGCCSGCDPGSGAGEPLPDDPLG